MHPGRARTGINSRRRLEELFPQLVLTAYKFKDGTTYTKIYFSCRSVSLIKSEHYGPCGRQKSRPGKHHSFSHSVPLRCMCTRHLPAVGPRHPAFNLGPAPPQAGQELGSEQFCAKRGAGAALPGRPGHTRGSPHLRAGGPQGRSS